MGEILKKERKKGWSEKQWRRRKDSENERWTDKGEREIYIYI